MELFRSFTLIAFYVDFLYISNDEKILISLNGISLMTINVPKSSL